MTSHSEGRTRAREGERRVRVLPDALVDQIAAGEVVERPASVVKELVENALDAGAARVRVEVREGGRAFIAVTDDGCGMDAANARLAVRRHATSKLLNASDLHDIRTFGFRGEALPAIASVSRLRLRTRTRGATDAIELRLDGGRIIEERAASGAPGTRVELADLFYNVPARRKFLKRPGTEWGHVADWMSRAALALPGVHFEVQRDERGALTWPAVKDPLDRIAAILSERDAAALIPVSGEEGGARLSGFASRPDHHRPNAAGVYLFVNGRPVRDRLLRHALLDSYRDVLPRGRFPTALLFLSVDAGGVDANVHPAKWEVRFADPQAVHRLVARSLQGAMASRHWLSAGAPGPPTRAPPGSSGPPVRRAESGAIPAGDWLLARDRSRANDFETRPPQAVRDAPRLQFGALRLLGQILATYLLVEGDDGLLLVDQHAAHERLLYERLRTSWLAAGVERQALLLTQTVALPPGALESLTSAPDAIEALGFEIERFADDAVLIRAVPALLAGRDPASLVRALADELDASQSVDAAFRLDSRALDEADRLFATLACHSARRQGDRLDEPEQRALLAGLDAIPWAPTCPHGRPVAISLERAEIERRFARR